MSLEFEDLAEDQELTAAPLRGGPPTPREQGGVRMDF